MFGRALAATAGLIVLAGCSGGGDDNGGDRGSGSPARSEAVAAPPAERYLEFPACDGSFVPTRSFLGAGWRRRSARIGPVRLLNVAGLAERRTASRDALVIRVLFPPSRSITIGVEGAARSRAGFLELGTSRWSGSASDLYPALLIEDCPELPPELGEQPAGGRYAFLLSVGVRRASCVPLVVTRDGGRPHRRTVSLGAGSCS